MIINIILNFLNLFVHRIGHKTEDDIKVRYFLA